MKQVNIHEAKTHLSALLQDVERGEEVIIAKSGVPIARVVRFVPKSEKRTLGLDRGRLQVPDDFDEPIGEIEELFYGARS